MKEIEKSIKVEGEQEFDLETFYAQMKAAKSAGPLSGLMTNMMGQMNVSKDMAENMDTMMAKFETIINSMTRAEKKDPELIRKSSTRAERIAKGSGTSEKEVRALVNQFMKSKEIYQKLSKDRGFRNKMKKMFGGKIPGL
jgi:signal recognition particle subunit SRP54